MLHPWHLWALRALWDFLRDLVKRHGIFRGFFHGFFDGIDSMVIDSIAMDLGAKGDRCFTHLIL